MTNKTIRDLVMDAELYLSIFVQSIVDADAPVVLVSELRRTCEALKDWYESPESYRYTGGFPITLETMVTHAKAFGQVDELRRLLEES